MHLSFCFLGDIKRSYKIRYGKHQIHSVRDNHIELREMNINDFTVKLKIAPEMPVEHTLTGEAKRQFNFLKGTTSDEITLSQLIDSNNRVTFVRGVAGMGKSTLAKQLVYGWADDRLYKHIKLCIMCECRDVNHFQKRQEKNLNKEHLFEEFVKQKFDVNLGDGDGFLFVVDGLDELYDISTNNSLIFPLLTRQIYSGAKLIITGRPHVESKLKGHGEIGGLRTMEIQGLSNEQIEEYVQKFPSPNGSTINLNNAIDSSQRYFPILHIPQFLNTFCCVAILERNVKIYNAADLYSWTLYLFLKQHADKLHSTEKRIPDIFKKYSEDLLSLSKICDDLLKSDKIILDADGSFPIKIWDTEYGFISGCFVDVSDNFDRRYQFKHITLMEFFSALHIVASDKIERSIKEHLENGLFQTVIFACQLVIGYASSGIIKHLLSNVARNTIKIKKKVLLSSIITDVFSCSSKDFNFNAKLKLALEVMVCFLREGAVDGESMLSSIRVLRSSNFIFSGEDCKRLCDIVRHLANSPHCFEESIKGALTNIGVRTFWASDLQSLYCLKFLTGVEKVILTSIKTTSVIAVLKNFGESSHKTVEIYNCTLEGEERQIKTCKSNINTLKLRWCKLDKQNFKYFCKWGISCRELYLESSQLNEERLEILLVTISNGYSTTSLNLKVLKIAGLEAKLSESRKAKVGAFSFILDSLLYDHCLTLIKYIEKAMRGIDNGLDMLCGMVLVKVLSQFSMTVTNHCLT